MGDGSTGGWGDGNVGIFAIKPQVNHEYVLEIELLSETTAFFTVFDSDGTTVLESHLYTLNRFSEAGSVPNFTQISLTGAEGAEMVELVAILPEPEAAPIVLAALIVLGLHRVRNIPVPRSPSRVGMPKVYRRFSDD